MDIMQLLWALNSLLLVVLGFFIKIWIERIKDDIGEIKEEIGKKASVKVCEDIHRGVDKLLHKHATTGTAGEVVEIGGTR